MALGWANLYKKKLPPSFRSFYHCDHSLLNKSELQKLCYDTKEKISYTDTEVIYIEEAIRNQSYCEEC